MRRVLTFLTAIALVLVSLCIGLVTADLPFWRRAFDLPLAPGESYVPTVRIGSSPAAAVAAVDPAENSLDPVRLEAAAELARAAGAGALLVAHRGRVQLERVFDGRADPSALRPADFLARPLAVLAIGMAHGDGKIASLDDPVSKYLHEWEDSPRGAITVRQLLNETSGLETGTDAAQVLGSRPFAAWELLPRFATSRGVRLLLGNDFESTALGFRLDHEPGGFFNISPVNTQLAAVIVERAAATPYEKFLEERLFTPSSGLTVELQMDRRSGMPAAHCCLRTSARGVLAVAELLRAGDREILPAGWIEEMLRGSRANPEFGLQIEKTSDAGGETWHIGGPQGGGLWIVPGEELSVVLLAPRDVTVPSGAGGLIADLVAGLRK
jgi:CubicO group peptidase (beta-lactamase class C family)